MFISDRFFGVADLFLRDGDDGRGRFPFSVDPFLVHGRRDTFQGKRGCSLRVLDRLSVIFLLRLHGYVGFGGLQFHALFVLAGLSLPGQHVLQTSSSVRLKRSADQKAVGTDTVRHASTVPRRHGIRGRHVAGWGSGGLPAGDRRGRGRHGRGGRGGGRRGRVLVSAAGAYRSHSALRG